MLGRYEDSVTELRKAIELDERNVDAYVALGVTHSRNQRIAEAVTAFEHALRLALDREDVTERLAELSKRQD